MIREHSSDKLLRPEFFETRESKILGVIIRVPKPVINYDGGEVEPGFNVGTRGNGVDAPFWPDDLLTENIKAV
jgi:hypothetical protein